MSLAIINETFLYRFARDELQRIANDDDHSIPSNVQLHLRIVMRNCVMITLIIENFLLALSRRIDGGVNRHNCRLWASEKPDWIITTSLHSPRTTVWAAIWQGGIIGPFFFDETVNSQRYLLGYASKSNVA